MNVSTLQELKERGEFFKKGKIIPQRILKASRKVKHKILFGSDCWAFSTSNGYVLLMDSRNSGSAVKLNFGSKITPFCPGKLAVKPSPKRKKKPLILLVGSPYTPGGTNHFIGNSLDDDEVWAWRVSLLLNKTIGG